MTYARSFFSTENTYSSRSRLSIFTLRVFSVGLDGSAISNFPAFETNGGSFLSSAESASGTIVTRSTRQKRYMADLVVGRTDRADSRVPRNSTQAATAQRCHGGYNGAYQLFPHSAGRSCSFRSVAPAAGSRSRCPKRRSA